MRKLLFGETWELPVGVAIAVALSGGLRAIAGAGGWWRDAGGFVLLVLVALVLVAALADRRRGQ